MALMVGKTPDSFYLLLLSVIGGPADAPAWEVQLPSQVHYEA
jgi:hypothetical protein